MNRSILRERLAIVVDATLTYLQQAGYQLPDDLLPVKAKRDKREPGISEKLSFERKMSIIVNRHFRRQAEYIKQQLERMNPDRKATITPPNTWLNDPDLWNDPDFRADMVMLLIEASKDGIDLYSRAATVGMDYTAVNTGAVAWARKYSGLLIDDIDATTLDSLQKSIALFVETPGMTIRDTMNMLPFDDARAERIAVTEITRAYAEANQLAGAQMQKEYPDLEIVKTWFTNNDDRVCEICGPLEGKVVGINEEFESGIANPPAHVNCRCWSDNGPRRENG